MEKISKVIKTQPFKGTILQASANSPTKAGMHHNKPQLLKGNPVDRKISCNVEIND